MVAWLWVRLGLILSSLVCLAKSKSLLEPSAQHGSRAFWVLVQNRWLPRPLVRKTSDPGHLLEVNGKKSSLPRVCGQRDEQNDYLGSPTGCQLSKD